jgi:hypothetical protein
MLMAALTPLVRKLRGAPEPPVLRGLDDMRVAVRMPWMPAWGVGMIALGASAFAAIIVVAVTLPLPPPMAAGISIWIILIGFTAFMVRRRRAQFAAGLADLTIDASARTATLPLAEGRKEPLTIPFADIRGLAVSVRKSGATMMSRGKSRQRTVQYDFALLGRENRRFPLASSGDRARLEKIADALHDTFGWPIAEEAFA